MVQVRANLIASAMILAGAVLYRFPPEGNTFYPECPIFRWTHWRCPGCGATRALAALLHGRVAEALRYNPLFAIVAPLLLAYFAMTSYGVLRHGRLRWPYIAPALLQCLLASAALFTLARNTYPL